MSNFQTTVVEYQVKRLNNNNMAGPRNGNAGSGPPCTYLPSQYILWVVGINQSNYSLWTDRPSKDAVLTTHCRVIPDVLLFWFWKEVYWGSCDVVVSALASHTKESKIPVLASKALFMSTKSVFVALRIHRRSVFLWFRANTIYVHSNGTTLKKRLFLYVLKRCAPN